MHSRSTSWGALVGDGAPEPLGRISRPPLTSVIGQRTPPTCPTSPLENTNAWSPRTCPAATPSNREFCSTGGIHVRSRTSSLPCQALPLMNLSHPQILTNIAAYSVESSITAEQCFPNYGRIYTSYGLTRDAPQLVGMALPDDRAQPAGSGLGSGSGTTDIVRSVRPEITASGHCAHCHNNVLSDITDVGFGLVTCLATPLDPGSGMPQRLAYLPVTTTAAARSAASKLSSANDLLQETSRFGDWVRRQNRRKKLERMQKLLAETGRLVGDTLVVHVDPEMLRRDESIWDGDRDQKLERDYDPEEMDVRYHDESVEDNYGGEGVERGYGKKGAAGDYGEESGYGDDDVDNCGGEEGVEDGYDSSARLGLGYDAQVEVLCQQLLNTGDADVAPGAWLNSANG